MGKLYFIFIIALSYSCNNTDTSQNNSETDKKLETEKMLIDSSLFQSGDIILKKGKGMISSQIVNILNEPIPFSHCGIFIKTDTGNIVIQSVAKEIYGKDGVQAASYTDFIKDTDYPYFYVVRLKNNELHKPFIEGAIKKLTEKAPFDYDFNYVDNSKLYCTELIYIILKQNCGLDFFKLKKVQSNEFLLFNSMLENNYFETVFQL